MEGLVGADLKVDWFGAPQVVLLLGDRERGLGVKTGSNQSVQIDCGVLACIMAEVARTTPPSSLIFPFSQAHIRKMWNDTLQRDLKATGVGPLHTVRHSKPSRDVMMKVRTLEEVRRRGRWNQVKSVQRYSRTQALVAHLADLPADLRTRVSRAEDRWETLLASAVRRGPGSKTRLGKVFLKFLDGAGA
jgi:hypothetical protein